MKLNRDEDEDDENVVPLVGTWIEIIDASLSFQNLSSCPSWARGLKLIIRAKQRQYRVVPLVGTWIEIVIKS